MVILATTVPPIDISITVALIMLIGVFATAGFSFLAGRRTANVTQDGIDQKAESDYRESLQRELESLRTALKATNERLDKKEQQLDQVHKDVLACWYERNDLAGQLADEKRRSNDLSLQVQHLRTRIEDLEKHTTESPLIITGSPP